MTKNIEILERQIENEMVGRIKEVIMMLGKGFAFIGNQYRIVAKENEYFIDLLFFNRILRSLFCVEIKAKKFKAEYAGKMNLYLGLLDNYVKHDTVNNYVLLPYLLLMKKIIFFLKKKVMVQ